MPAIVDGPGGGYWATALGLTGLGLAVVYIGAARPPDIDTAGAYLAGAGLVGVVAAVLRRRGFLVSDLGFAATVAVGVLGLALTPRASGTLDDAIALGVVGVLNVAGGAYQMVRGTALAGAGLSAAGPLTVPRSWRRAGTRRPQTRTARRA